MKPKEKTTGSIKVGKDAGRVKVFVRVRPQRPQEASRSEPIAITVTPNKKAGLIHVVDPKHSWEKTYHFDHVFSSQATNSEVCGMISRPIVNSAMSGFNGTLMAYGQTGSGKTYTLMAPDGITTSVIDKCFKKIGLDERHDYKVTMAYLQIYQEKIYDLLNSNTKVELSIREHPTKGIYVENLSSFVVRCPSDVNSLMTVGRKRLVFAETKMNRNSSRSHSVCQLTIERTLNKDSAKPDSAQRESTSRNAVHEETGNKVCVAPGRKTKVCHASRSDGGEENDENDDEVLAKLPTFDNDDVLVRGNIYLCDLAGSERLKRTQAEGERLSEAQHINLSLLELGNVIQALAEGKKNHVPFRNSTLTRLLQESLGGNCKTSLMVCVAPSMCDVSETKCSLNFGSRAMKITTNAYVNVEVDYKRLSEDLNRLVETREKDLAEMKKMYEDRILSITRDSEEMLREAIANSEKTLASIRYLYETEQTSREEIIDKLQSELESANENYQKLKMQLSAFTRRIKRKSYQTRALLLAEIISMQLYCALKRYISNEELLKHELDLSSNEYIQKEALPSIGTVMENSEMLLHLLKEYIKLGSSSTETILTSCTFSEESVRIEEEIVTSKKNGEHIFTSNVSALAKTGLGGHSLSFDESLLHLSNKTDDDKAVESRNNSPTRLETENGEKCTNDAKMESSKLLKNLLEIKKDLDGKGLKFLSQIFLPPGVKSQNIGSQMNDIYSLLREMNEVRQEISNDEEVDLVSNADGYFKGLVKKEYCLGHVLLDKALQCSVMLLEQYQLNQNNATLYKQVTQLQDEICNMKAQNNTLVHATSSTKNELEMCTLKLKEIITGKEALEDEINSIFQMLDSHSQDCFKRETAGLEYLRKDIETLLDEKRSLQNERVELRDHIEKLLKEATDTKKEVDTLNLKTCSIQHQLDSTSFELEKATKTREHLKNSISDLFQLLQSKSIENEIDEETKESAIDRLINGEIKSKVSCILREKESLESNQNAFKRNNETLSTELLSLKNQINEVEKLKADLNTELLETKARLDGALKTIEQNQVEMEAIFELLNSHGKEYASHIDSQNNYVFQKDDYMLNGGTLFAAVNSLVETKTALESKLVTNTDVLQETIAMKERLENDVSSIFQLFNMSKEGISDADIYKCVDNRPLKTEEGKELSLEVSSIMETNQKLQEELSGAQTGRRELEKELLIAKNELQLLKTKTKTQSPLSSSSCSLESIPTKLKDLNDGRLETDEQGVLLIGNRKLLDGSFSDLHKEVSKHAENCAVSNNNVGNYLEDEKHKTFDETNSSSDVPNTKLSSPDINIKYLQKDYEEMITLLRERTSQLETACTKNKEVEKENRYLLDEKDLLEEQYHENLNALEETILTLKTENAENKYLLEELTQQLDEMCVRQKHTEHENLSLIEAKDLSDALHRGKVNKLEQALLTLKAERTEIKRLLEERTKQKEEICAQQRVTEQKMKASLEARSISEHRKHSEKLNKLEQAFLTLKDENEKNKRLLHETNQEVERVCDQEKKKQALLKSKTLEEKQHVQEISKLNAALSMSNAKMEEVKRDFDERRKTLDEVLSKKKELECENKELKEAKCLSDGKNLAKVTELENNVLCLTEQLESCEKEIAKVKNENKGLNDSNADMGNTINTLEKELAALKMETCKIEPSLSKKGIESMLEKNSAEIKKREASILAATESLQVRFDKDITRLERDLKTLKKENERIKQISNVKQREIESVRDKMLEIERENKTLREFKISTEHQLMEMKNTFEKELLEVNKEQEKCKRLAEEREKELLNLSHKLNSLDNFVRGIEAELTLTKEKKKSYEAMLLSRDREFEELKTSLVSSKEQLQNLSEKLSTVTEEYNCLKNKLTVSESQRSLLADELKNLIDLPELKKKPQVHLSDNDTEKREEHNNTWKADLPVFQDDNTWLKTDLTLAKKTLIKLKEDVTLSNLHTRNLSSQLSSLRENSNQLEAELSTMRTPKTPRSRTHSTSEDAIRLEIELADSKQRVIDLQKKIIDVDNEKAVLLDRLSIAELQLEKVTIALETLMKEKSNTIVQLEEIVLRYKMEMKELEAILTENETAINDGSEKFPLKVQLQDIVKTTTAFKEQLSESNNKISVLENELVKTCNEKNEMEKELGQLRSWTKSINENQSENLKRVAETTRTKEELQKCLHDENVSNLNLKQSFKFYKKENEKLQGKCNDLANAICERCNNQQERDAKVFNNSREDELREELNWYKAEKKKLELLLSKNSNGLLLSTKELNLSENNIKNCNIENKASSRMHDRIELQEDGNDLDADKSRLQSIEQLVQELLSVEKQQMKLKKTLKTLTLDSPYELNSHNIASEASHEDESKTKAKIKAADYVSPTSKVLLRSLQELEKENSTYSKENSLLKFRILDLEKELEFLNFKLSVKEKSDHSGGRKALATVLASVKQQRQELQKSLEIISGEKEDLQEENSALKVKSNRLQKELALSKLQNEKIEKELNSLKSIPTNAIARNESKRVVYQSCNTVSLPPQERSECVSNEENEANTVYSNDPLHSTRKKSKQNRMEDIKAKTAGEQLSKDNIARNSRQRSSEGKGSRFDGRSIRRTASARQSSQHKLNKTFSRSDETHTTRPPANSLSDDLKRFDETSLNITSYDIANHASGLERVDPRDSRLPPEGMEDDVCSDTDFDEDSSSEMSDESDDRRNEKEEAMSKTSEESDHDYFQDEEVIVKSRWSFRQLFWGQSNESQPI